HYRARGGRAADGGDAGRDVADHPVHEQSAGCVRIVDDEGERGRTGRDTAPGQRRRLVLAALARADELDWDGLVVGERAAADREPRAAGHRRASLRRAAWWRRGFA